MNDDHTSVPDLLLERLALGELDATTETAIRTRLAAEPNGLARLEALSNDNAATLAAHPAESMARAIDARVRLTKAAVPSPAPWLRWWPAIPALAAAAIALVVIQPWAPTVPDATIVTGRHPDGVRTKGAAGPALTLFRQTDDGAEPLPPASSAGPGDRLQIHYTAASQRFGMVLSIDGNGVVTQHFPVPADRATDAAQLAVDPATPLPNAYELDAAPAFERFFLVTRAERFPLVLVDAAARALASDPNHARGGALALPSDMQQVSILVVKTSAPDKKVTP